MLTACRGCQGQDIRPLYQSGRHGFTVGRCAGCGLVFVFDEIPTSALKKIYSNDEAYERYVELVSSDKTRLKHRQAIVEIQEYLAGAGLAHTRERPLRLFDVGAGSGDFLALARDEGFEIYGNELSATAIRLAREKHGIDLSQDQLEQDGRTNFFDAMTMWSLIEHVQNPEALLEQAARLLRAGGVLFVYAPVWCSYDTIGLLLARAGWSRLLDRRISWHHLQLFPRSTLKQTCARMGFSVQSSQVVCEYNFPSDIYLEPLGVPSSFSAGLGRLLDWLIERRLFFRNNIRLFCQRNDASAH